MANLNLSQTAAQKKWSGTKWIDGGLGIVLVLFVIVLAAWGALYWYNHTQIKEAAALQAQLDQSNAQVQGEAVDRVTDASTRMSAVSENIDQATDSNGMFAKLESLTVPNVRLALFKYDREAGTITVEGVTDNFRYIAQQMVSFRSDALFSDIQVDKIQSAEGKITFTLKASLEQ